MTSRGLAGRGAVAKRVAGLAIAGGVMASVAWLGAGGSARAQAIRVARPRTLVLGASDGARAARVDGARTGLARTPLPTGSLHVEWRTQTGAPLEQAPLVDARGTTYVVGVRGEVVALASGGVELWRAPTGGIDPGPATLLSDDSVVFVDGAGEAVAVRDGAVRWRSRFGKPIPDGPRPAPLPLDDGGVVVATPRELALLDADGRERARTTLREPTAGPLVSALDRVVVVTRSGAVWTWRPGAPEPSRVATFGSPIGGGAALANAHTLVAVVAGGTTFAAVDLLDGTLTARAVAPAGLWLGPPAMRGDTATLEMLGATSEIALTLDSSGREIARALLASHPPLLRIDGGAPLPETAPERPSSTLLVDRSGTLAFGTFAGSVGVVTSGADAAVELLSDTCAGGPGTPGVAPMIGPAAVAGIAPLGPGSLVVSCHGGTVVAVRGLAP